MTPWYIYGAGGLGVETADILSAAITAGAEDHHQITLVEDTASAPNINGLPVRNLADCAPGAPITIAVGEPSARAAMLDKIEAHGLKLATIISPLAFVSDSATIEDGAIIAPFASIQARAFVGRNVAVNTQAIIGHDVAVEPGAVISSQVNLGGGTRVGKGTYVGMGALVKEGLTLGSESIIGMGSVVHRDIPDGVIALGDPARPMRRNEDKKVFK
ncbi:MAG: NeuD/PglB/VioB family sugar acetyltransferase [Pseudomonadota bacterium]